MGKARSAYIAHISEDTASVTPYSIRLLVGIVPGKSDDPPWTFREELKATPT